jgi:hypothetical protein
MTNTKPTLFIGVCIHSLIEKREKTAPFGSADSTFRGYETFTLYCFIGGMINEQNHRGETEQFA